MKKMYLLIGGILLAAVVIIFSIVSWNDKTKTTSESAKEKIEMVKKTDPRLTGDAPLSSYNEGNSDSGQTVKEGQEPVDVDVDSIHNSGSVGQGTTENVGSSEEGEESPDSNSIPPAEPGTAVETIKAAYHKAFSELEVLESSKIDQVVVQAKADHVSGKYSKEDLLVKYQDIALSLEAQADQAFYVIYRQLENDLRKNGHDVSEAVIFKNEYDRKKAERLSHMVSELSEF